MNNTTRNTVTVEVKTSDLRLHVGMKSRTGTVDTSTLGYTYLSRPVCRMAFGRNGQVSYHDATGNTIGVFCGVAVVDD